jgi:hypothetical protein
MGPRSTLCYIVTFAITISSVAIFSLISSTKAVNINQGVFSTNSAPYGSPYSEWLIKYWQWKVGMPKELNPQQGFTPEKCAVDQSGPVWFLAPSLSGVEQRICTIPAGKAVLTEIVQGECDYSQVADKNDQALIQCATAGNAFHVMSASVDGVAIKNLESYLTHTRFFNITNVKDNLFGTPAGTYRAYVEGYNLFLQPLSPGNHVLHFTASIQNPTETDFNYAADWTYHLIVKP